MEGMAKKVFKVYSLALYRVPPLCYYHYYYTSMSYVTYRVAQRKGPTSINDFPGRIGKNDILSAKILLYRIKRRPRHTFDF